MSDEPHRPPDPGRTFTSADQTQEAGGAPAPPGSLPQGVGRYHIKRIIASGGMGTVYEATQENPRRVVAVKVMKHGIASRSAMRRFEYEAQLLARLHHPGIAQIYEAGTHDDGSGPVPYFAMEYIPAARAITKYAEEKKLGTRQRLDLFAKVCDAVQHGHQKGIIHRDLKPGNVLVDAQGDVKIIDFGVARGTDSDLAVTTLQTDMGQLIGTLQYMSPEQCAADPHDIDVRSDVYGLGVVLYELLSGKLPYDVRGKPAYECTRVIREQAPGRLSTTLGCNGRPARHLRGDVETIVNKALEKDRGQRYQSAVELAQDIRRFLAGEAIAARPPSIVYQFRLFVRRHQALFSATAAVFGVLLCGLVISTWLYLRAEHEAEVARKAVRFVSELSADVARSQHGLRTAREVLDEAARRIDREFAREPLAKAQIHLTLANTYWELGEYDVARRHAEQALSLRRDELGEAHRDTLDAMNTLAVQYRYLKRYDEARRLQTETLRLRRLHLPKDDPDTLESMNNLAVLLRTLRQLDEAEKLQRATLHGRQRVLGPDDPHSLMSMTNLAAVLLDKGELDEAVKLTREALAIRQRTQGAEHPDTLHSMNNLAKLLVRKGEFAEAEQLYQEALAAARRSLGNQHPRVATLLHNLAELLRRTGKDQAAVPLLEEVCQIRQQASPPDNDAVVSAMTELGDCWIRLKRFEEAERCLLDAWARLESAGMKGKPPIRAGVARALEALYDACGKSDPAAQWRARLSMIDSRAQPLAGEE